MFIPSLSRNYLSPFSPSSNLTLQPFLSTIQNFKYFVAWSQIHFLRQRLLLKTLATGPFNCVGKQLALMELRTVITLLITNFDVHLAPGEDGTALIKESKDSFTLRMGDLNLVFEERSAEKV